MITLAPFATDEIDRLASWIPDAEALLIWAGPRYVWPLTAAQISSEVARAKEKPDALRMFVSRDGVRDAVGHIEIGDIDRRHGLAHLMRVLVAPASRGRGIGAAMVAAALRICFEDLNLHRTELVVLDGNAGALATYLQLGFVREGLSRDTRLMPDGRRVGRVHMGLLARECRERQRV